MSDPMFALALPAECPTCGEMQQTREDAATHYQKGCVPPSDCEKCGLPLPYSRQEQHTANCIGQTAHVLHNVRAGMVVYLSEEEWTTLQQSKITSAFPTETAEKIAARAVYGVEFTGAEKPSGA